MQSRRSVLGAAGGLALVAGLGVGAKTTRVARAHDEGGPHPAHIHVGTVDAPGEVVIPLSDVSADFLVDGEASAGGAAVGQSSAIPVQASVTTADVALSAIIEGGHVVMVHKSAEEIDVYVAGGDIGGMMMGANDLVVGLKELNESSLSGVAILHDNGDETTTVTIYLTARDDGHGTSDSEGHDMGDMSSPEADAEDSGEDSGDAGAGGDVSATIVDFAFEPGEIEVAAGTTVTWTNEDSAPHTVTARDGSFQSGTMQTGDTFSHTFEEAGSVEYFCEFHANMVGTVTVA